MQKKLFSGFLLITALTAFQCSGLVKLNLPPAAYQPGENPWLTPFGNNRRTNSSGFDVTPPYKIVWDKGYRSVITDQPLAVQNFLIFTVESGLLGFVELEHGDLAGDGRLAPGFLHSGAISGGRLYYSANLGNETVGSFNLQNLKHEWKKKFPHMNTSPLIEKERVYVGGDQGNFYSLDKVTGEKKWEFKAPATIYGSPAAADGKIFLGDVKGNLFCLNAASGEKIWQQKLQENLYGGPLIAEELLIIGSTSGIVYALDSASGTEKWSLETGGSIYGNGAYRDGMVFIGNNDHNIYGIDVSTGKIIWTYKAKGIINTAPLAGPDFVYFGCWDEAFYVLDRCTGEMIYRQEFDDPIKTSPLLYRGKIFIQTANDHIFCLDSDKQDSKTED